MSRSGGWVINAPLKRRRSSGAKQRLETLQVPSQIAKIGQQGSHPSTILSGRNNATPLSKAVPSRETVCDAEWKLEVRSRLFERYA